MKDWLKGELYPYGNSYFLHVVDDVWRISEGLEDNGLGRHCYFRLSDAPEDLKNWILLGAALKNSQTISNPDGVDCILNTQYFYINKLNDITIQIYLPIRILKQIKPLEEVPT